MALVMKADCSAGDSYALENLSPNIAEPWKVQLDVAVPSSTFTALASASFTADFLEMSWASLIDIDGPFLTSYDTSGGAHTFSGGNKNWWTDRTGSNPMASYTADTWVRSVVATWDTINLAWSFAGSTLFPDDPGDTPLKKIKVGGIFAQVVSGEVYYIDNVKVFDSSNSIVFSDDFESGTFSAWSSTVGDCSIVSDPFPGSSIILINN